MAKLDGSPVFHLGGIFGHVLSTSNTGRLPGPCCGAWAATVPLVRCAAAPAMRTAAARTAIRVCVCFTGRPPESAALWHTSAWIRGIPTPMLKALAASLAMGAGLLALDPAPLSAHHAFAAEFDATK